MSIPAQIQAALSGGPQGWASRWRAIAEKAEYFWRKLRDPAEASYRLGRTLAEKGLYEEAKYRFKFTLWREPERPGAWYNLACCHLALGEEEEAVAALKKALELNPKDESALFVLASIDNGAHAGGYEPHTTPLELVKSEFSLRAAGYDEEELGEWGYQGHQRIYEAFLELLGDNPQLSAILDGGCGTGLCAPLLRSHCRTLVALDVTPAILARAAARAGSDGVPYYDMHIEADLRTHLLQQPKPLYDAIILANVCNIIGGLAAVMDGAAKALKPGGWLILSTDRASRAEGYHFLPARRRFGHSAAYLKHQAEHSGLRPQLLKEIPLYDDQPAWMAGLQKAR